MTGLVPSIKIFLKQKLRVVTSNGVLGNEWYTAVVSLLLMAAQTTVVSTLEQTIVGVIRTIIRDVIHGGRWDHGT